MAQSGTKTLKTERLKLRRFRLRDLFFASWYRDLEITTFSSKSGSRNSIKNTISFVVKKLNKYRKNDFYSWAITYKGRFVGMVHLNQFKGNSRLYSFYYLLDKKYSSRGFMTEAVSEVIKYMKSQDVDGLFLSVDVNNIASQKVAEKCGAEKIELRRQALSRPNGRADAFFYKII